MKFKAISLTWLIPIVTLFVSAYAVKKHFDDKGPIIKITFPNAEGIKPGKTELKYRGIPIGIVKNFDVSDDLQKVIVVIQVIKKAELIASAGSKFWIVEPEISINNFRHLETLVSGKYIEGKPAPGSFANKRTKKAQYSFEGIEAPNKIDERSSKANLVVNLIADEAFSLKIGAPVLYKGIEVGFIKDIKLLVDGSKTRLQASIFPQFSHLVRSNSKFWDSSSSGLKFGLSGVKIKGKLLENLFKGGSISFATPEKYSTKAKYASQFELVKKYKDEWLEWNPILK